MEENGGRDYSCPHFVTSPYFQQSCSFSDRPKATPAKDCTAEPFFQLSADMELGSGRLDRIKVPCVDCRKDVKRRNIYPPCLPPFHTRECKFDGWSCSKPSQTMTQRLYPASLTGWMKPDTALPSFTELKNKFLLPFCHYFSFYHLQTNQTTSIQVCMYVIEWKSFPITDFVIS